MSATRPAPTPWARLVLAFTASRLGLAALALLSTRVVEPGPHARYFSFAPIDLLSRWDSGWYLRIAKEGYTYFPQARSSVAFFPGYPMLVRAVHLIGLDARLAGYLVANAAALACCILLWRLVARSDGEAVAERATTLFLLGPLTVFFSAIYSESLFLACVLGAFLAAVERRVLLLALCGFAAGLTRSVGVLLALPLLIEALSAGPRRAAAAVASLAPLAGLGAYAGFLWVRFGDPLAFSTASAHWGRHLSVPWESVRYTLGTHQPFYEAWFLGFLALGLGLLGLGLLQRQRASFQAYAALCVLLYTSSGMLEAIPRYLAVVFPLYVAAARVAAARPRLEPWIVGSSAALATLSTVLFVNGYWFT